MKKQLLILITFLLYVISPATAQLQVDKQIQMTGSAPADAKISGIKSVSASGDAVSADYIQRDSLKFAGATGSSNAYSVALVPALSTAYTIGMVVHFKANFPNTAAATLNVNLLGAKTIKKNYNADLAANDILNGQMVSVMYDGTNFQMLSQLGNVAAPHGKQLFTSGGTFNVPSGVGTVWVSMCGGGGGGGAGNGSDFAGGAGGGGGGSYLSYQLSVSGSYSITVGSAGIAGNAANGGNGGNTSFGALLTANGGTGGNYGHSGTLATGGAGGTTTGGVDGNPGSNNFVAGATASYSAGGSSVFGGGGSFGGNAGNGVKGGGFGGGGGGGGGGTATLGGAGAPGFVLVEW